MRSHCVRLPGGGDDVTFVAYPLGAFGSHGDVSSDDEQCGLLRAMVLGHIRACSKRHQGLPERRDLASRGLAPNSVLLGWRHDASHTLSQPVTCTPIVGILGPDPDGRQQAMVLYWT